jgi:tetratricopeptide (TPR) repeat protein
MFDYFENFKKAYYRNKGQKLLVKGMPEKAYYYLEKALMLDNSPSNMYNLALTLLTLGKHEEAKDYLVKICAEFPGNELAVLTLAELYMQKREWEKAENLLSQLVKEHPSNLNYKKYYERIADPDSRESYIKAKELLNQAQNLLQQKQFKKAEKTLLEAEILDPGNPYIKNNLGSYYLMLENDPKKALDCFQKAFEIDPSNMKFRKNLSAARKKMTQIKS